jgi:hypothetical protein
MFTRYTQDCYPVTPMSNYQSRMNMVHNAAEIRKQDRKQYFVDNMCRPCYAPGDVGTMLPEQSKTSCNSQYCTFGSMDPYAPGLGVGRDYGGMPKTQPGQLISSIEGYPLSSYDKLSAAFRADRLE